MNRVAHFEKVSFEEYAETRHRLSNSDSLTDDDIRAEWEAIKLPTRATQGSAGYDFYLPIDIALQPDSNLFFPTGIRCQIDNGWALMLFPKSGLGSKYGTRLLNTTGIVDSDYYNSSNEGHIMCGMTVSRSVSLWKGNKFMQGLLIPYGITKDDNVTESRDGGFGSTGA